MDFLIPYRLSEMNNKKSETAPVCETAPSETLLSVKQPV